MEDPKDFYGSYVKILDNSTLKENWEEFEPPSIKYTGDTIEESLKKLTGGRFWSTSSMSIQDIAQEIKEIEAGNECKE